MSEMADYLTDYVDEQIKFHRYLVIDDETSDDEVHIITPCGMVDNNGRYRQFPVLGLYGCEVCLGATIVRDDGVDYCYHDRHFQTHTSGGEQ